jgi:hypothetical protein
MLDAKIQQRREARTNLRLSLRNFLDADKTLCQTPEWLLFSPTH